jgi:hypothetical protein
VNKWVIFKTDVSKAHRRCLIQQKDWKYQVARIKQMVWVNKPGTYGVASAQLYWGRVAALILRLLYALFPAVDWMFVFVDDIIAILKAESYWTLGHSILLVMTVLGTPVAWHKTSMQGANSWVGFSLDANKPCASVLPDKRDLVLQTLESWRKSEGTPVKLIHQTVARLQWMTGACPLAKPLLLKNFMT